MKKTLATLIGLLITATPVAAFANEGSDDSGAHASVNVSASVKNDRGDLHTSMDLGVRGDGSLKEHAKDRANQEIERRIDALNHLSSRIDGAKRIGGDDKSSLIAAIDAQISALMTLKAQIQDDDSTTTLRADIQSITKSYRIFMLVIPQGAITAASDRILNVAGQMEAFSAKLEARINAATNVDTAALNDLLDDYNAKVADAKVQANAAASAVADLKPDNGDASVAASNKAALSDARAKIVAGQNDLKAAREDARKIAIAVKGHGSVEASTTDDH